LALEGLTLTGRLNLQTRLASSNLDARRFRLDGTRLTLDKVTLLDEDGVAGSDWWARLSIDDGDMVWRRPLSLNRSASSPSSQSQSIASARRTNRGAC